MGSRAWVEGLAFGGSKDPFLHCKEKEAVDVVIWVGRLDGGMMGEFPLETFVFFCDLRIKVIGE